MAELVLMRKRIDLDASPLLYNRPLSEESFREDWEIRSAEWRYQDGALWGRNPLAGPGTFFAHRLERPVVSDHWNQRQGGANPALPRPEDREHFVAGGRASLAAGSQE